MPQPPDRRTRRLVAVRAGDRCEYCLTLASFVPDPFSTEHILPRSRGGSHQLGNLASSCQGCKNRKGAKTVATDPVTSSVVPLCHPRTQRWEDHFQWTQAGTVVPSNFGAFESPTAR